MKREQSRFNSTAVRVASVEQLSRVVDQKWRLLPFFVAARIGSAQGCCRPEYL